MPVALEQIQTEATPGVAPSPLLRAKIAALRRKHLTVALLTGVSLAVGISLELLALAMFLDWWLDLPWVARLVSLLAQGAVFGFVLTRYVILPLVRQPDDDELALMVERTRPEFHSRLIAAMQLTRPGAIPPGVSASLVEALVRETEGLANPVNFQRVVPTDRLKKFGLLAAFVLAVGALALSAGGSACQDLLKRAFLSHIPVPRKTRVIVIDGNKTIGRGDSVRLEAYVQGIIPSTGRAVVRHRNRREQPYALEQDRDEKIRFGRTIDNVQDSFTYQIQLGDGLSPAYEVKAIARPTVATIECDQEFPAYTRLKPQRRSLGDLTLLAGSRLKLKITATKDIAQAALKIVGREEQMPLAVDRARPRELLGELLVPASGLNGFSVQMLDTEGMESRDAAVYRVEVLPDKPPAVRVTYPERKEELATRQATMIVGMEVSDDFAIAKLRLHYKVSTIEDGAEKTIELDLGGEAPQRLRRRHEWKLGEHRPALTEGSLIEYWLEAEDNNDATGPGRGRSDHQLARVVSEAEKRADLLNRAGDSLSSISDVAGDQEKLNKTLGAIILEKTGVR